MNRFPVIACCLLLAACGQTGPLYLPDQAPPKKGLSIRADTRDPGKESGALALPKPAAKPTNPAPPPAAASIAAPPTLATPNP